VTLAAFGHLYAVTGQKGKAQQMLKDLTALSRSGKSYVSPYYFAIVYAGLEENDLAIEWLNKAYAEKSDYLVYLNVEPLLDSLRSDARFAELVHRVGL